MKSSNRYLYILILICTWFLTLLPKGADYEGYASKYGVSNRNFEFLYAQSVDLFYQLTPNFDYFFIAISSLYIFLILKFYSKFKFASPYLLVMLFFLVMGPEITNGIRQSIAIGLFWYSLSFDYKIKKIIPLLLFVCSVLFHTSSIILLPILIIYYFERKQIIITLSILVLVVFVFFEQLEFLFQQNTLGSHYRDYLSYENKYSFGKILGTLFYSFLFIQYLLNKMYKPKILFWSLFLILIFNFISYQFVIIIRLVYVFMFLLPIFVVQIWKNSRRQFKPLAILNFFLLAIIILNNWINLFKS